MKIETVKELKELPEGSVILTAVGVLEKHYYWNSGSFMEAHFRSFDGFKYSLTQAKNLYPITVLYVPEED